MSGFAHSRLMFSTIATERLHLRRLVQSDDAALFAYRTAPEVARYQCWRPESIEETREFIQNLSEVKIDTPDTWFQLAIVLPSSGELVGDCGLHFLKDEPNQTEIGITLAPQHARQGYASETLHAVLELLFDNLEKHRVFASVDPKNLAAMALFKRLGMRQEAHFVESVSFDGAWVDDVVFGMLRREWLSRCARD